MQILFNSYRKLFARRFFYKFNKFIYYLSLRGMGILNYESNAISGERSFLRTITRSRDLVVLDIGANEGSYSATIKKIAPSAQIYSFEPHPKTFSKLKNTADYYGFHAYRAGLGAKKETGRLFDYAGNETVGSQHASIIPGVIEKIHGGISQSFEIDIITLDDFVQEHNISRIDLLKIDTEGNELDVIKGGSNTIKKGIVKTIHFEFNEMNVLSRVYLKDFIEFLPNYEFYRMVLDGLVPLGKYNAATWEIFAYQNIVAIKK